VTPKLLPNLNYTDNITTLFVYNGPWVESEAMDINQIIGAGKALIRQRGAE
jgi:hypothetical protein